MNLRIATLLLASAVLSACGSTASRPNHTPADQAGLQNACARHFANVADPFERGNRITACVRNRRRLETRPAPHFQRSLHSKKTLISRPK